MRWLNENSRKFLSKGYLLNGESAEDRIMAIARHAEDILQKPGFADKFYEYMGRGWYSLSTPVWANFGRSKGLPISCFGGYVEDSMSGILYSQAEAGMMSKYGGGTSGYLGDVRPRGSDIKDNGTSSGSVHFMSLFETITNVVSQGSTRKGHYAAYLPADHGDVDEFLDIGTEGNPLQNLNHGVVVTDEWMQSMVDGDEKKREVWAKIIQRRGEIGFPYIMFGDNANNNTVDVYKGKHKILASNLCTEIMLPANERWSFVCCLSSLNILHYDEWKDTDAVETMVYFLDAVMEEFIRRLESFRDSDKHQERLAFQFMERAYNFAKENRALGLGVLGWHSYLQSHMIPFESDEALTLNKEIFQNIRAHADAGSKSLAEELGEPEMLKGKGRRNTTLMAIAPTTSSSFILGQVSQGIEPVWSNCYVKDIDKMKVTIKNPFLTNLLERHGKNDKETWDSIRDNDGSVAHLDFLSYQEKDVFKTFAEIDPIKILIQASDRQQFIDQGQSLNLMIGPSTPARTINNLYLYAWKAGIKSLYYQHSISAAQELNRKKLIECKECEA